MALAISRWWSGVPTQQPLPPPGPHLFDKIVKQEEIKPFVHALSKTDLLRLKHIIKAAGKNDSPLAKKVDAAYQKVLLQPQKVDLPLEAPVEVSDSSFVNQGSLTQAEMIKKIASEGKEIKKLCINTIDDEILEIVASSCPNLESLVLYARLDKPLLLEKLTDNGITALSQLTQLKEFTYNAWDPSNVSEQSFINLFLTPAIQNRLTKVSLCSFIFGDSLIPVLNTLKSLETLDLYTSGISSTAMATLSLPALKTLGLSQSSALNVSMIDDKVLGQIATFTSLQSLTLDSLMTCSETAAKQMIGKLTQLTHLKWCGFTFTDNVIAALPPTLTSLAIGDCSKVSNQGFGSLLRTLTSLVTLQLQKANGFAAIVPPAEGWVNNIKQLPRTLQHLYLHSSWVRSYEGLPPLKSLAIQNPGQINPSAFGNELGKLPLTTLRIIGCETFSDQQLQRLANSPLVHTLVNLQIVNAPLSKASVKSLERFSKLKALMLGKVGFDEEGAEAFINSSILKKQLTHLFLNHFVITPALMPILAKWPHLQVVFLGNILEHPFDGKFYKFENIEKTNGVVQDWLGEIGEDSFGAFLTALNKQ